MISQKVKIQPLSANKMFYGRKVKTAAYRNYEKELSFLLDKKKRLGGEVEIVAEFHVKNMARCDTDNFTKPFSDILVKNKIIDDDRKIRAWHLYKYKVKETKDEHIIFTIDRWE